MARSQILVALTAAGVAIFATFSLLRVFIEDKQNLWTAGSGRWNRFTGSQSRNHSTSNDYLIGVGKADITGPITEINFMGYADPDQVGSGLRQRLFARTFIIGSPEVPSDRIVYVVLDTQSGDTAVRQGVLEGLQALGDDFAMYGQQNVAITGTHSHSGPGAWLNYLLPQITSKGFDKDSYEAIVQGTLRSIQKAHSSLKMGSLAFGSIRIPSANINRSKYAYLANPKAERDLYQDDVDKDLVMLSLRGQDGKDLGVLTWFPVHGTSMLGNNTIVTGDNKGVAADMFEKYARGLPTSDADFVAGFSQSNVGDTSPNIQGAWCESGPQEGQQCDFKTSLCDCKTQPCHGRGPHWGLDDAGTASTYEIGKRQYSGSRDLFEMMLRDRNRYQKPFTRTSTVKAVHVFVDFANRTFTLGNGTIARTCPAALGYSFAAGTTDGPGAFDFKQQNPGAPNASPLWAAVRNSLHKPGPDQIACHQPKPILLDVGETVKPYLWTPNIVDIQLFRVGGLFMIISPGEATTMAGRRWKSAVAKRASKMFSGTHDEGHPHVVLGGPANSYTHYIATPEEYEVQRYEGASTLYGSHTLDAYMELTRGLVAYLGDGAVTHPQSTHPPTHPTLPKLDSGPPPPINTNVSLSFIAPVVRDSPGFFQRFGDVLDQVRPSYRLDSIESPVVQATFVAANPRSRIKLESDYASVERYNEHTGAWTSFRDDSSWSLLFQWERTNTVLATSMARISWELAWEIGSWGTRHQRNESCLDPATGLQCTHLRGRYRLRYRGDAKGLNGATTSFEGFSNEFDLI